MHKGIILKNFGVVTESNELCILYSRKLLFLKGSSADKIPAINGRINPIMKAAKVGSTNTGEYFFKDFIICSLPYVLLFVNWLTGY